MKILLIGKNGQLGQEIVNQAVNFNYEIKPYSHHELDITNAQKLNDEITKTNPDVVINTTAYHVVAECDSNPLEAFNINTVAVKNLAEICSQNNKIFVTYSTDYVFDGCKGSPYVEEDNPNPVQMYGISKLAGEIVALNYNSESIVIRTCGVYGGLTGSRSKKGNFVLTIIKEAQSGKKKMEISSEQIVSPTYAYDLAKATYLLLEKKPDGGIYHMVNSGYCSWADFAKEIVKLKNLPMEIIAIDKSGFSSGVRKPLFSALKNSKAKKLGIELPIWQDALSRYLLTF